MVTGQARTPAVSEERVRYFLGVTKVISRLVAASALQFHFTLPADRLSPLTIEAFPVRPPLTGAGPLACFDAHVRFSN